MPSNIRSSVPALALAYGVAAAANLLLSVVVGRGRGAAALGDFALAVACARIFFAASDLGLATQLTRELSRDRHLTRALTSQFVAFRSRMVPFAMLTSVIVASAMRPGARALFALVALALGGVYVQSVYEATLLAHDRQGTAARMSLFASLAVALGCTVWWCTRGSVALFGGMYAVASACTLLAWAVRSKRTFDVPLTARVDWAILRPNLHRSWPIGVSVLLGIAALRCSILILGAYVGASDVGTFAAVDTFVTAGAIIQVAVSNATFPALAASFGRDPAAFRASFWRSNALLALVGVALSVFLTFEGTHFIGLVFPGRDFTRMSEIVPIAAWSAPALLLVHHNIAVFAAADRERLNSALMVIWLAAISIAQFVLIPRFGLVGAAWGLVVGRTLGAVVVASTCAIVGIHRGEARA